MPTCIFVLSASLPTTGELSAAVGMPRLSVVYCNGVTVGVGLVVCEEPPQPARMSSSAIPTRESQMRREIVECDCEVCIETLQLSIFTNLPFATTDDMKAFFFSISFLDYLRRSSRKLLSGLYSSAYHLYMVQFTFLL